MGIGGIRDCPRASVEQMFRDHISGMHKYANELSNVLGRDSPIVERTHSCAMSCREALDAAQAIEAQRAETTKIGPVADESAVGGNADAPKGAR